jgi:hypothetical protein
MSARLSLVLLVLTGSATAGTGCATGVAPDDGEPDARIIHTTVDAAPNDPPDAFVPPEHADAFVPPAHPDAAPPCTPMWQNILANTAFDLGPTSWTETSTGGFTIVTIATQLPIPTQSGAYAAWMAGYDSAYDQLFQSVTVPSDATALRMSGWRCIASDEAPGSGVYDIAGVGILDSSATPLETLASFTNEDSVSAASCAWTPFSATAAGVYAGQSVIFFIEASTDGTLGTSFFFDTFTFEAYVCR